jgi:hypothetical protein
MGATRDLLNGLAGMIVAAGFGVQNPPGVIYAPADTAVFFLTMPASPDRVIVLNAVSQGDNITMPLGQVMVQVRVRGLPNNPLDALDLSDSLFGILHGTKDLTFGSVHVIQMNRKVNVPMGQDAAKRSEIVDQYYLDVDAPATINRPAGGSW